MKKNVFIKLLTISFVLLIQYSCDDTTTEEAIPISPILKEIQMPNDTEIVPGQTTKILGLGFSREDKLFLVGEDKTTEVEIVEANDNYIAFVVPIDAGGEYTVIVERSGKQTTLDSKLIVPFIVPLTNVKLPEGSIVREGEVFIEGDGFQEGDIAQLTASFYPSDTYYNQPLTLIEGGVKFDLPEQAFGLNNVVIIRNIRKSNLGTILIETNVGDEIGGGIVFWVNTNKSHGLIASKANVGTSTEQFGPEVAPADAVGTSSTLGSGLSNTEKIVSKMAQLRTLHGWPEWQNVKIAAELCADLSISENDLTYTDWYLPSREELIELFKVKIILATKGYAITPNNYWTSSEVECNEGWAAYYVNFYEETNIVSGPASKSGWKIGVRPIRSY